MPRPPRKFNDHPFAYHQEIELRVDTLTNLGAGLGRIDGWVVMVPFSLPGERIRARVFRNQKGHSEADLMEVLDPSPHRIPATCDLFGTCGGCQYQTFTYEEQLRWKQRQVRELLEKMARIPDADVQPVIPSPRTYGYRSKITPHFQKPKKPDQDLGPIGFLRAGQRFNLVDVPHCPIASDRINEALPKVREETHAKAASFKKGATLLLRDSASREVLTDSHSICEEHVGDITFHFAAGDFFQNNPSILPAFVDHVREQAVQGRTKSLVDAYCGCGLFALTCANAFEQVAGIEVSEGSITWARENASRNAISNVTFHLGSAEGIFDQITFAGKETAVVIDPPRKGCSEEFLDQLFQFGPARVVYVSCNPATQMRDLARFREADYEIETIQPFDLFPQTKHLECVITLSR